MMGFKFNSMDGYNIKDSPLFFTIVLSILAGIMIAVFMGWIFVILSALIKVIFKRWLWILGAIIVLLLARRILFRGKGR